VISGIGKGVIGMCPNTRRKRKGYLGREQRRGKRDGEDENEADCRFA
jgi:hypothetical protein